MISSKNKIIKPGIISGEQSASHDDLTMRLIMNSALDAIICIDRSGKITLWNPQAEKTFGWSEAEALGKYLTETIIPVQYRERHEKGFNRYLKTGEGRC